MNSYNVTNLISGYLQLDNIELITNGNPFIRFTPSQSLSLGLSNACISFENSSLLINTAFSRTTQNELLPETLLQIDDSSITGFGYYDGRTRDAFKITLPSIPVASIGNTGLSSEISYTPFGSDVFRLTCNSDGVVVNQYYTTTNITSNTITYNASTVTYNGQPINWLQIAVNQSNIATLDDRVNGSSSTSIQSQLNSIVSASQANKTNVNQALNNLQNQLNGKDYATVMVSPNLQDQINLINESINSIADLPQSLRVGVLYGRTSNTTDPQTLEIYGGTSTLNGTPVGDPSQVVTINGLRISYNNIDKLLEVNADNIVSIFGNLFQLDGTTVFKEITSTKLTNCNLTYDSTRGSSIEAIQGAENSTTRITNIQSISPVMSGLTPFFIQSGQSSCGLSLEAVTSLNMGGGSNLTVTNVNGVLRNTIFNIPSYYPTVTSDTSIDYGINGGLTFDDAANSVFSRWDDYVEFNLTASSYSQTFIPISYGEIGYFTQTTPNTTYMSYILMDASFTSHTFTDRIVFPKDPSPLETNIFQNGSSMIMPADRSVTAIASDGIFTPKLKCNYFSISNFDYLTSTNLTMTNSANATVTISALDFTCFYSGSALLIDSNISTIGAGNVIVNIKNGKLLVGDNTFNGIIEIENTASITAYSPGIVFLGYASKQPVTDLAIYGKLMDGSRTRLDKLCFNQDTTYINSKGQLYIAGVNDGSQTTQIVLGPENQQTTISTVQYKNPTSSNTTAEATAMATTAIQCNKINPSLSSSAAPVAPTICDFPLFIQLSTTTLNDLTSFLPLTYSENAQVQEPTPTPVNSLTLRKIAKNARIYKIFVKTESGYSAPITGSIYYTDGNVGYYRSLTIPKSGYVYPTDTNYYIDVTNDIEIGNTAIRTDKIEITDFDGSTKNETNTTNDETTDSFDKIYNIVYNFVTLTNKGSLDGIVFVIGVPFG